MILARSLFMKNFWEQVISDLDKPSGAIRKKQRIRSRYYTKNSYLTQREYECVNLIQIGLTMKEVGMQLELSPRTVEFYLQNAKQRFKVKKTKDLVNLIKNQTLKKIKS